MRTMTATDASRSFAALLDEAERGEIIVITRGGRRVATLGPASAGNGAAVLDLLAGTDPDAEFAADMARVRDRAGNAEAAAWPAD